MALALEITCDTGYTANYWKITAIRIDRMSSSIYVELAVWKDAEARLAGLLPMRTDNFRITSDYAACLTSDNIVERVYDSMKTLPQFINGTDC